MLQIYWEQKQKGENTWTEETKIILQYSECFKMLQCRFHGKFSLLKTQYIHLFFQASLIVTSTFTNPRTPGGWGWLPEAAMLTQHLFSLEMATNISRIAFSVLILFLPKKPSSWEACEKVLLFTVGNTAVTQDKHYECSLQKNSSFYNPNRSL